MNPLHKTVYFGDKSFHFVSEAEYDPAAFDGHRDSLSVLPRRERLSPEN